MVKQTKGDSRAIRKPLHTPKPYGERNYNFQVLEISENLGKRQFIVDKKIKEKLEEVLAKHNTIGKAKKELKKKYFIDENGQEVLFCVFKIPEIRYRKRQPITKLANRGNGGIKTIKDAIKFINKVSDVKIRQDLFRHLKNKDNDIDKAFSVEGLESFNISRKIPVYRLPIAESSTEKFKLGDKKEINKKKFGEAESGTNIFFNIYLNEEGKRSFETVPLNEVIIHQKWRATLPEEERNKTPMVPVKNIINKGKEKKSVRFLFSLSPGDLVFIPTYDELENIGTIDYSNLNINQKKRIYKMVSATGGECHFVPNRNANEIIKNENGTNSKEQRIQKFFNVEFDVWGYDGKPIMIKEQCVKLIVNRLGHVVGIR